MPVLLQLFYVFELISLTPSMSLFTLSHGMHLSTGALSWIPGVRLIHVSGRGVCRACGVAMFLGIPLWLLLRISEIVGQLARTISLVYRLLMMILQRSVINSFQHPQKWVVVWRLSFAILVRVHDTAPLDAKLIFHGAGVSVVLFMQCSRVLLVLRGSNLTAQILLKLVLLIEL